MTMHVVDSFPFHFLILTQRPGPLSDGANRIKNTELVVYLDKMSTIQEIHMNHRYRGRVPESLALPTSKEKILFKLTAEYKSHTNKEK